MDVVTSFIYGDLEEDTCMTVPERLESDVGNGKIRKLQKSLYGLKQAPRKWNGKLSTLPI